MRLRVSRSKALTLEYVGTLVRTFRMLSCIGEPRYSTKAEPGIKNVPYKSIFRVSMGEVDKDLKHLP